MMAQSFQAKLGKLWGHPGFQAKPATVLLRGAGLAWDVLRGVPPVISLTEAGERLRLPADFRYTTLTAYLFRDRVEEELGILDQLIGSGANMLDIGANIGLYTLRGASIVGPTGRVVAIEPGSQVLEVLRGNLALNDFSQVRLLPVALSSEEGRAQLFRVPLGDDPQAFSLLPQDGEIPSEEVVTRTLDAVVAEEGLTRIDLIKMDVEGLEPQVLKGGAGSIGRFRPMVIFEINASQVHAPEGEVDAFRFLVEAGYQIAQLRDRRLVPVSTQPEGHGNLVAIHPEGAQPRAGAAIWGG
jgi:FkbM family methyltransferase